MTSNTMKQPLELEELTIDLDIPDDRPESTPENDYQLIFAQKELRRLTSDLHFIINNTSKNKSLISKAAELFSHLPTWGKIAIGLALTLPILITGLVLHIGILLLISGVIALTCVLAGLLLDEHHRLNSGIPTEIKHYLTSIHNLMTDTIEKLAQATAALNQIRQELSAEINRLEGENNKLTDNVNSLTEANHKMDDLSKRIAATLTLFISNTFESNNAQKAALERLEQYIYQGNVFIDDANELQQKLTITEEKLAKTEEKLSQIVDKLCQSQIRQEKNIDSLIEQLKTVLTTSSDIDSTSSSRFYKPARNTLELNPVPLQDETMASSSKMR